LSAARRDIVLLSEESVVEVLSFELMPGTLQNPRSAVKAFMCKSSVPQVACLRRIAA
jgi:hypothetical protein